jgi:hypothetical protein
MKLSEIVTAGRMPAYDEVHIEQVRQLTTATPAEIKLPGGLELRKVELDGIWIALWKDDLMAWAKLRPVELHGKNLHVLDMVYVLPQYRKTYAAGWMLVYAKQLIGTPIIVSDTEGTVLFADAINLVKRLHRHADKFRVFNYNLKTGEQAPFDGKFSRSNEVTLMFEAFIDEQRMQRLAESMGTPCGKLDNIYELINWFE